MALVAEQLVGRAAELAVIDRAVGELDGRRFGALELVGEPGIGKTRLLSELSARADDAGRLALSGSASELERELPFWVFVDALDEYVQSLDPRRLGALGDETLAELGHVLPSLHHPGAAAGREDERYRTHRAVRRLLEVMATTKPLVLLLDDLHWADSGSIELLGALLRRPPDAAVLLALAVRPRQVPERLSGAMARAHGAGILTRVELGGLSAEESRELLGAGVDGAAADKLHEESGGNPFYLQQLARAPNPLAAGGDGGEVAMAGVDVPHAVAAALAEELALLPAGVRRVLEGAAVAGDPFEPELAATAAAESDEAVMDALDELLRRDLVRPTDVPRRFRFRHPLVRRAVYEAAPGGWRLGAHERGAAALAAREAPATARAHHVERSARHGDEAAVAVLREAGLASVQRAPATAARWFAAALRLLPAVTSDEERGSLLAALAQAHFAAGQFYEAHATLLEALELVPEDAVAARVTMIASCAGVENLLGLHHEAHARLTDALDALSEDSSPARMALMRELAVDGFYRMDYRAMRDWARRALDAARRGEDRPVMASALGMVGLASVMEGDVAEAEAARAEASALVRGMSDEELAPCLDQALDCLAATAMYLDRNEEAAVHSERALSIAYATGQRQLLPVLFWTGCVRTRQGRLGEAGELLDAAVEIARLSGHAEGLAWNLFARSLAAGATGDTEAALACGEESAEALRGIVPSIPAIGSGLALASALAETGDPQRATQVLATAGDGEELRRIPAAWRPAAFEVLTRSGLAAGAREAAERAAHRARELADAQGLGMARAFADRAEAALTLDAGDPAGAAELALAAAQAAAAADAPVEAAIGRMLAGRALAAAGDRDRAASELDAAAAAFDSCGAIDRRDAVERELGRLGRRPHRRTRRGKADGVGLESLTERELEVARLVVDRKTNSQIAKELFLSPKTVETHIRHLFQKLEVSSRVDVARVVERADRAAP
jgi:DNA-binding CsgD family transcriptional regulator/tetratricopeptide (TPR) repeat protein